MSLPAKQQFAYTTPSTYLNAAVTCYRAFSKLRFASYRFDLSWRTEALLPSYQGSTLRGSLLANFKQLVCPFQNKPCAPCLLKSNCLYVQNFERTLSTDQTNSTRQSLPFILNTPTEQSRLFSPGEQLRFGMTLLEDTQQTLPQLICALQNAGKEGLGKGRKQGMGRFTLTKVTRIFSTGEEVVFDASTKQIAPLKPAEDGTVLPFYTHGSLDLRIRFLTPLRIQSKGNLVQKLDFPTLIRFLLRRLRLLLQDHTPHPLPTTLHDLLKGAQESPVSVSQDTLYWHDWMRYSNRQKTTMTLGGLLGEITFSQVPAPYLWFINIGEHLHLGKNTSFGLGRYEVEVLSSTDLSTESSTLSLTSPTTQE